MTEDRIRARKRLVMFVPGLIAFGLYRLAKHVLLLSEPVTLLTLSGLIAMATAAGAYRVGRERSFRQIAAADGNKRVLWLFGWIGFAYGIQLSLLVLALLWFVGYDYLKHPDGPAMMAIIIACTAVARDAFEIGHVRRLEEQGRPFPTFPDSASVRTLIGERRREIAAWLAVGMVTSAGMALLGAAVAGATARPFAQLAGVMLAAGSVFVAAYFAGQRREGGWGRAWMSTSRSELLKFWWWPGLAFASTYFLVLAGGLFYLVRAETISPAGGCLIGVGVGGIMALYGYYLGDRRQIEDRLSASVPTSMLRCPFVMGILRKSRGFSNQVGLTPAEATVGKTGSQGVSL